MKKKYYLTSIVFFFMLSLFSIKGFGQEPPYLAPISDQSAMVGELFTLDVNAVNANPAETYELTLSRPGMTINPTTGLISWTPANASDGGKVTVRAYNSVGESVRSFFIYLSDAIECSDDLISYWKFDETSGTVFEDFKGGYSANALNTVTPVEGIVDGAQLQEPVGMTDQYYYVTDEGQYDFLRSESFSVSVWFKWTGEHLGEPNNQVLVARGNPEGQNITYLLYIDNTTDTNNPKIALTLRPAVEGSLKTVSPNIKIDKNQWYHVVAVVNGAPNGQPTDLEVFVNGQRSYYPHTFTDDGFLGYGAFDLNIGFWDAYESNRYPFNGAIDEVLVYRKKLTQTEVSSMYNDGLSNTPHCKPGNYYPLVTSTPVEDADEGQLYTYTFTTSDFDGDPLTKSAVTLPSWLTFTPATGILTGTPGNDDIGEHIVKLQVSDTKIDIFQEFTITVANVNDPPEITSAPAVTQINEGETFTYTLTVTDPDPDDVVTLSAPVLPTWMTFNPATGVLQGTPTNDQVGYSPDSTFNITLQAQDLAGATDIQEFTLKVINVNDLPEVLSQRTVSTDRNTPVSISISDLTVSDPDNRFPSEHQFKILDGTNYTYSGNNITPALNFYGDLIVNTEISDPFGKTSYGFEITVNYVNLPPVFTSTPKTTANEGSPYSYLIQVTDPDVNDPNINQDLIVSAVLLPSWLTFDAESNLLLGIPDREDAGENQVSLSATDGQVVILQNFTILVKSTNNLPIIITTPLLQINNYSEYTYTFNAVDVDADDVLSFSAQLLPSWLSFNPETRVLSGIPEKAHVGTHTVILMVTDGYDEVLHEFDITVLNVNSPPAITSVPASSARVNSLYTYLLEVIDYEGDNLTFTSTLVPAWLTFNSGSKVLSGTPAMANLGDHTVIITVSDGVFTVNHQFTINVTYPVGIELNESNNLVNKIYPNPASDYVIFQVNEGSSFNLEITDITGKIVVLEKIESGTDKYRLDLSNIDKGIYIYKLSNDNQSQSGRLIVK